jgi:hypothetical protein
MARKEINIGIEGNDGTGDSIRDSFGKVNENFQEIYAVLGQGGSLSFIGLDDVLKSDKASNVRGANEYLTTDQNKVLVVDSITEEIVFKELRGNETIVINQTTPGVISFSSLASALINDADPTLAANLNGNFKRITNISEAQLDTDATTKGYVDGKLSLAGTSAIDPNGGVVTPEWGVMTGPLILSRNPIETDDLGTYAGRIAATKSYVDSKTFTSAGNLYVATNGQDYRTDIPENQIGRSPATAFASVQRACEVAEELVNTAPLELGPYQKTLTYNNGTDDCTLYDIVESPLSGTGATATVRMGLDDSLTLELFGGIGYQINDELGIGAASSIVPAVVKVIAVDAVGTITGLQILDPGVYDVLPTLTNIPLIGGSGDGLATVNNVKWKVVSIVVDTAGSDYGSASVIFSGGGGGSGAEATTTEIGGEIKEITVVRSGTGYTSIPTVEIFLPRLLLETDNKGTDFFDDLREGQLLRGVTSNAICRIVSHDGSRTFGREIFDVELVSGIFENGEVIQYGDPAFNIQITIEIESGFYYENYPLKIPANVSLRGSEFRRVIIRPKPGVSQSPWARVFFRRDPVIDGIRVTNYEYGYHYLTDPLDYSSRPKNNDEMDVFLCNDATIVRNLSCQGHGGFMMVLDPDGQILSKSPYCQTGTSLSKSIDTKIFAGGQFVDGFSGNLQGVVLGRVDNSPEKILIGGLLREPELPTSFAINEDIYRISLVNRLETDLFSAKVLLEQNRTFIQAETIAWINGEFQTLNYDEDKCYRDIGLIVDAVINDLLYGGYLKSTEAGRLYFVNGGTVVSGQVTETTAAIRQAGLIAVDVINQDLYSGASSGVTQTTIPSITDGGIAQSRLEICFDLIATIVEHGENLYAAKTLLQNNKEFIQAETIKFINATYPSLTYDEALCKRDVGYIVDAMSIDIFGDFNNSLRVGWSYYTRGGRKIPQDQLTETVDAINFAKDLMLTIVKSGTVSPVRTRKTFNPATAVTISNNTLTIPLHGFTTGSKLKYTNGGGTSIATNDGTLTNNGIYYAYVIDGDNLQLYTSFDLIDARERETATDIEVNLTGVGTGTSHTLEFYQETNVDLTEQELIDAGIVTGVRSTISGTHTGTIDTGIGYINTILNGGNVGSVPGIYPQYECVLDTPWYGSVPAAYQESYCSRDVGLILEAVTFDFVLNSNFQSINAGRSYLRSYASKVTTDQKLATITALVELEEQATALMSDATAISRLSANMTIVKDIINNGLTAVPAISLPLPTGMSGTDNKLKAKNILVANNTFIQEEIIAWIDVQKAGNIAPFTSTDVIDGTACARDVHYIVDAICYDLLYGGNSLTKNAAEAYYSALATGGTVIDGQQAKTAAALTRLKTVIGYIVVNNNSSWTKTTTAVQDISLPTASASETTAVQSLTDIIIDYVADADYDTATPTVNPTITAEDAGLQADRATLIAAKSTLQSAIISYLNDGVGKVVLSTAGNKSMLGNDFTQVNDMGYGIFATNNGLIESVSIFTYYCHTAYYSLNGAQIRCLNGSSAHGVYALKAEGADPNEVPDSVTLKFPLIQTAQAYENLGLDIQNTAGSLSLWVSGYQYTPRSGSIVEIDHTGSPTSTIVPVTGLTSGTKYIIAVLGDTDWNAVAGTSAVVYAVGDTITAAGAGTGTGTVYTVSKIGLRTYVVNTASEGDALPPGVAELSLSLVAGQEGLALDVEANHPLIIKQNEELVLGDKEDIVATRPSTALIFDENRDNTNSVIRVLSFSQYQGADVVDQDIVITSRDGYPYVLLSVKETDADFTVPDGHGNIGDNRMAVQALDFASSQRILYQTSGAMIYDGSTTGTGGMIFGYQDSIYEITDYEVVDQGLTTEYGRITFRNVSFPNAINRTHTIQSASKATTCVIETADDHNLVDGRRIYISDVLGMTELNDSYYYVKVLTATTFELHSAANLTSGVNSTAYTTFVSGADSVKVVGGLTYSLNDSTGNLTLSAGVRGGATGDITVNISTMRATGHDMLDIGTGSYADTNYPNNIFGQPANTPDIESQTVELNKGRVFFVSTDQSGNFKVGDFFGVDQGTGKLTLDAKIDLRGIDSLRLRSGQEIFEFSNDSTLGGTGTPDPQAVPTEQAVRVYLDKRLGLTGSTGSDEVLSGTIGPGFLPRSGQLSMSGNIDMDNNRIDNLQEPVQGAAGGGSAVPRQFMTMAHLEDGPTAWRPETGSPTFGITDADVLVFTGTDADFTNATIGGYLTFTRTGATINATINDNMIVDADVNYDAAISQHKLKLNTVTATSTDGLTVTAYTNTGTISSPSTTVTVTGHGLSEGDTITISGETTVTALNGDWKATSVATNTFVIPVHTASAGVLSGAGKLRKPGILSAVKSTEFDVTNGYLTLKNSSSTSTGVNFTKLAYISPSTYDTTDQTLSGTITKVLGRRGSPTTGDVVGPPVPLDARTIVEDGDGLSRAEVPSVGAVVRTATGTGPSKFSTIAHGDSNVNSTIVQRNSTNGGFSAGEVDVSKLTSSGNVIVKGEGDLLESGSQGLQMTVGSTTKTVLSRILDNAGQQAYYTVVRDGQGNPAIRINTGATTSYQYTAHYATEHRFYTSSGSAGTIQVGNGGTIASGTEASPTAARMVGTWTVPYGSSLQATWADLAEYYTADKEYEPGTVVEFGGDAEVRASTKLGSTRVAGVVSTNPAYVLNEGCQGTRACVALQGRVPCKVVGKIQKGDLMVTSQIIGVAVSAGEAANPGTIIGKALTDYNSDRIGTIEVAVGRL